MFLFLFLGTAIVGMYIHVIRFTLIILTLYFLLNEKLRKKR